MHRRSFFLSTILLLSSTSFAASTAKTCPTVDLRKEFGSIRDQGTYGWCGSFALADLIGHKLKVKPPDLVSALDVAVTYVTQSPADLDSIPASARSSITAWIPKIRGRPMNKRAGSTAVGPYISYIYRGKLCLESQISSEKMVRDHHDEFDLLGRQIENSDLNFLEKKVKEPVFSTTCNCDTTSTGFNFATMKAANSAVNDWSAAQVRMTHDHICKPNADLVRLQQNPAVGLNFRHRNLQENSQPLADLSDAFLNDKKPFAIGYNANAFKINPKPGLPANHMSLVAGRRWDKKTQSCQLLVRNSWGTKCDLYSSDVDCEKGYLWISQDKLLGETADIFKIE